MQRRYYRPVEYAERIGVPVSTVRRMCRDGTIVAARPGNGRLWFVDAVATERKWKESNESKTK